MTATFAELGPRQRVLWYKRTITSFRLGWPEGALDACEEVETAHPTWMPYWTPAGYHALHTERILSCRFASGSTPAELVAAMAAMDTFAARAAVTTPTTCGSDQ